MNAIQVEMCSVCRNDFWASPRDNGICFSCFHKMTRENEESKKQEEHKITPVIARDMPVKDLDGYVYVMKSGRYCKIGMTSRKSGRLNEIRVLFPVINLVQQIACKDAGKVETYLHKKYKKQRVTHEWYKLTKQDLEWFKSLNDYDLDSLV